MGLSRQENWSGLQCLPPEKLPDPGIEPVSLISSVLAGRFFTTRAPWEAHTFALGPPFNCQETETQSPQCHPKIFRGKPRKGYGSNSSLGRLYNPKLHGKYSGITFSSAISEMFQF